MERRSLLKGAASLGAIPIVSAGAFVYGTPAAAAGAAAASSEAEELLRLPLSRIGLPSELQGTLTRLVSFWQGLAEGGDSAKAFAESPAKALAQAGLTGQLEVGDPLIDVMRLSLDPDLKAMATKLDVRGFLREMRARGLTTAGRSSAYRRQVQELLAEDHAAFKQAFQSVIAEMPHLAEIVERDERLNALTSTLRPGIASPGSDLPTPPTAGLPEMQAGFVLAAVVVVIAAAVVAYVSVSVGVTVGVMAGFAISVAVTTAVVASGGGGGACEPECHFPNRIAKHERETRRAATVARILGRPDLAAQIIRADIDSQLAAITQSAIDLQLLKIPAGRRSKFDRQLRQLAYDAAGVPM
jgi:hypothetical protein